MGTLREGGHYVDVRFRDGGTPLRPFYPNDGDPWIQQGYVWAATGEGVLKAGAIWRRFGLDWDGSWYGSVPYYDGFMLATDWGISWEASHKVNEDLKVDYDFQFIFHNYLDYSLVGADPLSVNGSSEVNQFVGRVVPTWRLSAQESLALGLSGLVGEIRNGPLLSLVGMPQLYPSPGNETLSAWAVDLTYTHGNFRAFVEGLQAFGELSPANYVSGGPSNRVSDVLMGFNWTQGPITYRASYSMGFDDNPSGTQSLRAGRYRGPDKKRGILFSTMPCRKSVTAGSTISRRWKTVCRRSCIGISRGRRQELESWSGGPPMFLTRLSDNLCRSASLAKPQASNRPSGKNMVEAALPPCF